VTRTTRARSFDEFQALIDQLATPQGVARGLRVKLRPSDVVISPFAKCGTTWLQQIVHGLRTRGDMDFDDISRVIPWIEVGTDLGLDLNAEQVAEPRAFKSHLGHDLVPKGGRYIVSLRDPGDAAVSMYRFMEGWFLEPGAVSIEDFVRRRFIGRERGGDYWAHLLSWWSHRHAENVLLLAYEEMKVDLPGTVRRVADFIGISLDEELLEIVVRQSSFAFMTEHQDKFDDLLDRQRSERVIGLPPGSDAAKVREGSVGARKVELPPKTQAALDAVWHEEITPRIAFADYGELLAELTAGR